MNKNSMSIRNKLFLTALAVIALALCLFAGGCTDNEVKKVFSDEQISEWKKQNKSTENKHVLNGGYYINFNGVDYPVVFESGSIVRFDNMPDELFFITMYELYTDKNLKHRCAYIAEYDEYYSFFAPMKSWRGYILDGKRPALGTVLYLNENDERKFMFRIDEVTVTDNLDPDDIINVQRAKKLRLDENGLWMHFSDSSGKAYELINTPRKLYYYIKNQVGVEFDARAAYTYVAYPSTVFHDWRGYYRYDNDFTSDDLFREDELQRAKEDACLFTVERTNLCNDDNYISSVLRFQVDYLKSGFDNKEYSVVITSDGKPGFRDDVFYGTLKDFADFLKEKTPIDKASQKAVSYFSYTVDGENFAEVVYNELVYRETDKIYAVWEDCKKVTLRGDTVSDIYLCRDQEYTLPYPTRAGYEFVGWYDSSDYTGQKIEKISYSDTYTDLYPKFDKTEYYTLTFEDYNGERIDDIRYSYGDEVQLPVLKKTFYTFAGWCTDSECTSEPIREIDSNFFGSYHLYPCFIPNEYTILLTDNDSVQTVKLKYGIDYKLPVPDKAKFLGWFDINGVQYTNENGKSLAPFTDGADIQLIAKYE